MATSVISNVIKDPTGAVLSGVVVTATLMPVAGFRVDTATEVARTVATTSDGTGSWSLALEQNANITPANTYYEVVELIPASQGGTQVWHISVGASAQTVLAALVSVPPSASQASFLTQAAGDARYQALGSFGSVVAETAGAAGTSGVNTSASRSDHVHPAATGTAVSIGAANSAGSAATFSASDHVHTAPWLGAWTNFTPTLSQSNTVTCTVTYANYIQIGKLVIANIKLAVTGSGTGSAQILCSLPVAQASSGTPRIIGTAWVFDSSAASVYKAICESSTGATSVGFRPSSTTANDFLGTAVMTAALASGDLVTYSVMYEAA